MSTSIAAPAAAEHHAPLHGAFGQDAFGRAAVERHSNALLEKNSMLIEQLGALPERVAAMQAAVGQ